MDKKLEEKYLKEMEKLINGGDTEADHRGADYLLCELLKELGFDALVSTYRKIDKWYA